MTYHIFTLLYTVVSGAIFLSCLMIAFFRRKPPMFMFAYSFGCSTASALVVSLQTTENLAVTAALANILIVGSNLLLYRGTWLFYEGGTRRGPKRLWAYLVFGSAVIIWFSLFRYDLVSRSIFMALFCSVIFGDFAHYLRRYYESMNASVRTAFVVALIMTEASYIGRILIVMSSFREANQGVRAEGLNIYALTTYAVTGIFWLATLILLDDSRMMDELEAQNRILEPMAHTDKLTGLFNRNKLYAVIADYIGLTRRLERPLTFILIDIDHFKDINDTYGHAVGDQALVRLAEIIRNNVRATDRVFRWGGEEFLILAVGTPAEGGAVLAESLRQKVAAAEFPVFGRLTASFGVAEQMPQERVESWFRRADLALYQAKKAGRNQVMKWSGGEWPVGAGLADHFEQPAGDDFSESAAKAAKISKSVKAAGVAAGAEQNAAGTKP